VSVGKRRTLALGLAFVVIVGALGACSSDDSDTKAQKQAQVAKQRKAAKAKRARAVKLQQQRAIQRKLATQSAASRRQAITAALIRQQQAERRRAVLAASVASPASDLAAIRRSVHNLNVAFRTGVGAGIVAAVKLNYWVSTGVYSGRDCSRFARRRSAGIVASALFVGPRTLQATPGWVDPATGRVPQGRIYSFAVNDHQTQVRSGARREVRQTVHATVRNGRAQFFFRCA
jgi:hypothetical protein